MATLQKIRSKGPLLVGVIALALFAFIAGDALRVFQPTQPHDVGSVDGNSLSISEYQRLVDEYSNIQKSFSGRNTLTEMETNQIKDMVWNTFVDNQLISIEADKLGLTVTETELNYVLDQGINPSFRLVPMFLNEQTGRFDKDKLFMFLAEYAKVTKTPGMDQGYLEQMYQIHTMWAFVERSLIQERLNEKYTDLVTAGFNTNNVETKFVFEGRVNSANLSTAVFPFSSIADDQVTVTDADIKKEYDAKKGLFKQNTESRLIKYIDVKITPSAADIDALEVEVAESADLLRNATDNYASIVNNTSGSNIPYNDLYISLNLYPQDVIARVKDAQIGETVGPYTNALDATINAIKVVGVKNLPDSVQFRMLQIQGLEAEALAKKTDSIVNILANGGSFAAIAEDEQQPGEAFWISEQTIANQEQFSLYTTLTEMKPNEIKTLPIPTGNIILQLVNRKNFSDKYKLAVVKRDMEISSETANNAYNKFSQFVAENSSLEKMVEAAEDEGYHVLSQEITITDHTIGNVASTKEALRWSFDAKVGSISNIFECGDADHLLVVGLTDIIPAGYRPLKFVADDLRSIVLNNKKAEYITSEISKVNPNSIADASKISDAVLDTVKHVTFNSPAFLAATNSSEPVISGYASVAKEGVLSNPAIKGNTAIVLADVISREKLAEEYNEAAERSTIESEYSYFANRRTILSDLIKKAKIVDVRYLYF